MVRALLRTREELDVLGPAVGVGVGVAALASLEGPAAAFVLLSPPPEGEVDVLPALTVAPEHAVLGRE